MTLTLVLGGIRSGKSAFAELLVKERAVYVATALDIGDEDLAERIAAHQSRRPTCWPTLVAVERIAEQVASRWPACDTVLLDGLGMVVGAALDDPSPEERINREVQAILADVFHRHWIVVSDEVGLAPVAATEAGRRFQDLLGATNIRLASVADRAIMVVAGRPIELQAP